MNGILNVQGNKAIDQQKLQEQAQYRENARPGNPEQVTSQLAGFVQNEWSNAKNAKLDVTDRLTNCLQRRKGVYSPSKLAQVKDTGGSEIFMKITGAKCRAAKAWLSDLFNPVGDKPYSLEPTPISELPPELEKQLINEAMQGALQMGVPQEQLQMLLEKHSDRLKDELKVEAEERCERMSEQIEDVFAESNWRKQFNAFLNDLVTYPTAVIKGPVYRRRKRIQWVENEAGAFEPQKKDVITREFRRVSPFDAYPCANTSDIEDGGFCEHLRFTPKDLAAMRGTKGYDTKAIDQVLTDHRASGLREWMFGDGERERLEGRNSAWVNNNNTIDGVEYTGTIQGRQLVQWGVSDKTITDPLDEYSVSVIVIGTSVIRAMINPDPSGRSYYYASCWNPIPGAFWGEALPEILSDTQDACNGAARALINNLAIASGPQVAVDVSTLPKGQAVGKMHPWRVWQYNGKSLQGSRPGVSFFSAQSNANELLTVYERFAKYADEISGLPAFAYGSDGGAGAAKTASGLSMLMNAATKPIKEVVRQIDINVIEPAVTSLFHSCMLDPTVDKDAKGDANIVARGSDALIHKESALLRQQELMQITNNPTDMAIIGMEGRREQLREVYKSGELPVDRIVPTEEEMNQRLMQQQEQPPEGQE